jgi:hypothetical protein
MSGLPKSRHTWECPTCKAHGVNRVELGGDNGAQTVEVIDLATPQQDTVRGSARAAPKHPTPLFFRCGGKVGMSVSMLLRTTSGEGAGDGYMCAADARSVLSWGRHNEYCAHHAHAAHAMRTDAAT